MSKITTIAYQSAAPLAAGLETVNAPAVYYVFKAGVFNVEIISVNVFFKATDLNTTFNLPGKCNVSLFDNGQGENGQSLIAALSNPPAEIVVGSIFTDTFNQFKGVEVSGGINIGYSFNLNAATVNPWNYYLAVMIEWDIPNKYRVR